jgi:polysaccharide biosynthesis transport protein
MKQDAQNQPVSIVLDVKSLERSGGAAWRGLGQTHSPDRLYEAAILRTQLARLVAALRSRWWILLLTLGLVGGPAVLYAFLQPPRYESKALMYIGVRLNLPEGRLYAEELTTYLGTQAELIKSPSVMSHALRTIRARFPEVFEGGTNSAPGDSPFDLTIGSSARSSTLELRLTGPAPEATRAFLNQVMEEYRNFKLETRKQTSFNALSSITDQINAVKLEIAQVQENMTRFEMSNNVSYLTEYGLSAGSHLARLVEVLSNLRTELRMLELLSPDQLAGHLDSTTPAGLGSGLPGEATVRNLATSTAAYQAGYYQALQQLQLLKARREEFSKNLRPGHSKMVKLNQEIAGLEQLLKTLKEEGEQQALAQIVNRKQSLQLQIENLESQYRSWETNAVDAARKLAEHDRMKQDLQRSQALYDRLLGLVLSVDLSKSLDQEPLSPVAPASPARRTHGYYVTAAAGIFLAAVLGVALVLLLEVFNNRFTSVTELSHHLAEEVVGQIPDSPIREGQPERLPVVSLGEQHAFAESFRSLRSSLLFMPAEAAKPRIILVTSAIPKEGKTTVSANLAATLALAGSRVLLIDADLRRSSLHHILKTRRKPGLWEILTKGVEVSQAIVSTSQPNLMLLPAGEGASAGSEVFLRYPIEQLLRDLAGQYDYVLIDSAPVLATDDAATLGPKTDGALMVVQASHTSSQMAREALHRLHRRNVKILGVIYNRAAVSMDYYSRYTKDYYGALETPTADRATDRDSAGPAPSKPEGRGGSRQNATDPRGKPPGNDSGRKGSS